VAVFIPLLFMGGQPGRLFREFAVTLSAAVLISLVVSLTTTPMMCAWLLKRHDTDRPRKPPNRVARLAERAYGHVLKGYEASLDWALHDRWLVMLILVAVVALNGYLFVAAPKGFFPQQDTGQLNGGLRADQSISFQAMQGKLRELVDVIRSDPAVDTVVGFTGGARAGGGFVFVNLKPRSERSVGGQAVIARLRPQLARITGVSLFLNPVQDLRMGGRQSTSTYQYTLKSDNATDLRVWALRLADAMKREPELTDVDTDQQENGVESYVTIDRDTAARVGLSNRDVDSALYDAFGQRQVSTLYTPLNQYHVVMEAAPEFGQRPDTLREIYVRPPNGSPVPLSALTHYEATSTPLAVSHQGQFPSVTLSFNLAPGASLGDAVAAIQTMTAQLGLPSSIQGSFQGTAQAFQASLANVPLLIVAALLAVYVVLGVLYESYIHPLTILSTLPSAGVGAILALLVFRTELSVIALIGILLLIGIVKKNAILMIDFALEAERSQGKDPVSAIAQACLLRFRPIMMTTLAALLGALPLALGTGVGAELRRPLGIAIVGGLLVSQILTLYTTPVVYLYLDRAVRWFRRRGPVARASSAAHAGPEAVSPS
jgi:multidrug efflux pump